MVGFSGDGVICDGMKNISMTCMCSAMLYLHLLQHYSLDIDECVTSLPICGSTGMCVNTNGSFVCVCPPGFEGDICSGKQ